MRKESCFDCKRCITHGGTCRSNLGMTQVCLGYEKDPRGQLLRENNRINLNDGDDLAVGEWTAATYVWPGHEAGHKLRICKISRIKWNSNTGKYEAYVEYEYFKNPDKEENQEAEKCKLKKYLKDNGIKNVAIFKKKRCE